MPFVAHPYDMYSWYKDVEEINKHGITLSLLGVNPIWMLFLGSIAYIYNLLSRIFYIEAIPVLSLPKSFDPSYGIAVITDPLFNTLVKIPLLLADILSAYLIYRISYFYSKDNILSKRSALLYYLSPIVIWISAAWGQFDSLAVLFSLLAIYFLLVTKRIVLSSLSLWIAVMIKVYPIVFLIPFLISILRFDKDKLRKLYIFLSPLVPLGAYLIFYQKDALIRFLIGLIYPNSFFYISGFGLTYWSISLIMPVDFFWSRVAMNLVLLLLISLSIYYITRRTSSSFDTVVLGSLIITVSFFLSWLFVSEQRSLILLSLISLAIIYFPTFRIYFFFISITAFLYAQKNFPFYLLPLASRFPDSFLPIFSSVSTYVNRTDEFISPTFYSGLVLFIVGLLFSVVLSFMAYSILRNKTNLLNS